MDNCFCCGKTVTSTNEKKRRKLLSNPSMLSVVETLTSLASKFPGVDSSKLHTGYACRSCAERLQLLIRNFQSALPFLPKFESGQEVEESETGTLHQMDTSSLTASPGHQCSQSQSPHLRAKIYYRSRPQTYNVTPLRRRICKPLIRRSYRAFAVSCIRNNKATKDAIIKTVGQDLQREIAAICSDSHNSIIRQKSNSVMANFSVLKNALLQEMETRAPTLLTLLKQCLHTTKPRKNTDAVIVMIASLLCKHRRPSACQLQRFISAILYAGHSSKQVFQRLQKLGVCLSHSSTIRLLDALGCDFDLPVKQWKENAEEKLSLLQVNVQATPNDHLLLYSHSSTSSSVSPASPSSSITLSPSHLYTSGRVHMPLMSTPLRGDCSANISLESGLVCSSESPDSATSEVDSDSESERTFPEEPRPDFEPVPMELDSSVAIFSLPTSMIHIPLSLPECTIQPLSVTAGFKIVFDNIDMTVRPRHMTADAQTRSLHYVHAYAVKDRIDFSCLPSERSSDTNLYSLLPNSRDYSSLKEAFAIHVSRVIVDNLAFFNEDFKRLTPKHIPHKFSAEMSKKSDVVPIGVLPKNETTHEEMMEILEEYKKYVPSKDIVLEEPIPRVDTTEDKSYIPTLLGGDYLSVARAREAQYIRRSSELEENRLDGLIPVAEDWHAKVCMLEVFWKRLYKTSSGMERGTLYQIRNLINRRNVSNSPKSNVNAAEDFFEVVVTGYIIAAVMSYLGMSSLSDMPLQSIVPHDIWMKDDDVRQTLLHGIARHIVDKYVDLSTEFKDPTGTSQPDVSEGTVLEYSREMLSLGLLILEFKDAVREGDGDRDLLVWKYFMLLYKASGRKNYAIEALTLLSQYHLLFPPNLAEQLKCSRFINMHGLPGHNISCDLHMEHLNMVAKTSVDGLGANKSEKAIGRVGKAVGMLASALHSYDKELGVPEPSGKHSDKAKKADLETIVQQLLESAVFDPSPTKKHNSFSTLTTNLFGTLKEKHVKDWMAERFSILLSQ